MLNIIGLQTLISREIQRFSRVFIQSLISPWISAFLYIVIFGVVIGGRIEMIGDYRYIDFVLPGLVMLNLIQASYQQGAFSLYMHRFQGSIQEILVAPFSYMEMLLAFLGAAILRGIIVGMGVYMLALLFTSATMAHFFLFVFYAIAVAFIFSCVGLLMGMWSNNFEQLNILNTFVIMPLTFLGGIFNSISMLPEKAQIFVRLNPFFYFVDGLRYAMIGVRESNAVGGFVMIIILASGLAVLLWYLFSRGWRIKG